MNRSPPEEFVENVRTATIDQLTAIGITHHSASLMISVLNEEALCKIERVDAPSLPRIRIKRRRGGPRSQTFHHYLLGEKCSAILSIALLSKGKPLVIDQPEDDLDHAFIINSIVQGISAAKSGRQIIAATHNPNIPVLGDAEMVVSSRPTSWQGHLPYTELRRPRATCGHKGSSEP